VQGYEGRLGSLWPELCADAANVLEVGGNIGLFSVLGASACRGRYTVVEPLPQIADVLRGNLARNALDRVEVLQTAVIPDREPRKVSLNVPSEAHALPVGAHLDQGVEVTGRGSDRHLLVDGLPVATLAAGRDLIKIDAEGIEAELLLAARPVLDATRPTLVIEVLPEAVRLGDALRGIALDWGATINVVPAYGSDTIVPVAAAEFDSSVPGRYNSKDIVLAPRALR
jgi:FkbM family methyltransferase